MSWLFLVAAAVCGAGAYVLGWPAWTSYREREARDANAERYLAWRGRAASPGENQREGPSTAERRRIWLAGLLAGAALALLVAFFIAG
jgi:hypothetical protein